jgi:hypothetical protein
LENLSFVQGPRALPGFLIILTNVACAAVIPKDPVTFIGMGGGAALRYEGST